MGRKIIGFLIIFLGVLLLAGLVYFVFVGNFSFNALFDKFKWGKETPAVRIETVSSTPMSNENINNPVDNQPVKIIANTPDENGANGKNENSAVDPKQFTKDDLRRMAASFAERFGSFSNHSNFSNIKDLKIYMSRKMKVWADQYVLEKSQSMGSTELYYGITTKAVEETVVDFDEDTGQAVIQVGTRRREATSSTSNVSNVFSQNITIMFTNEDGAWKIDDANWEDRK